MAWSPPRSDALPELVVPIIEESPRLDGLLDEPLWGRAATVSRWLEQYGAERIVLGLDVKLGADGTARIATHGWTEASELSLDAAIERYIPAGLVHVLCTDIARDGAMTGPNVALYGGVVARWPQIVLQASGGVSRLADLEALAAIGVPAAISGKALLEKKILLEEVASFLPNA